jgi:hypothetical protein
VKCALFIEPSLLGIPRESTQLHSIQIELTFWTKSPGQTHCGRRRFTALDWHYRLPKPGVAGPVPAEGTDV